MSTVISIRMESPPARWMWECPICGAGQVLPVGSGGKNIRKNAETHATKHNPRPDVIFMPTQRNAQ